MRWVPCAGRDSRSVVTRSSSVLAKTPRAAPTTGWLGKWWRTWNLEVMAPATGPRMSPRSRPTLRHSRRFNRNCSGVEHSADFHAWSLVVSGCDSTTRLSIKPCLCITPAKNLSKPRVRGDDGNHCSCTTSHQKFLLFFIGKNFKPGTDIWILLYKLLCHTYTQSAAARALEESQKHLKSHQVPPLSVLQVISKNHKSRLVRNRHNSIRSGCGPELHLKTCVRFDPLKKGFELLF